MFKRGLITVDYGRNNKVLSPFNQQEEERSRALSFTVAVQTIVCIRNSRLSQADRHQTGKGEGRSTAING